MGDPVGARPSPPNSSVAFLCGTAAWADGFLSQGKKWAQAIAKAVGGAPAAQIGDLGNDPAAVRATLQRFGTAAAAATITDALLDQHLGGLRGHSLVLVTHGLESHDPSLTKKEQEDTQGVLFYNHAKGDHPRDLVLFKMHLDFMETKPTGSGKAEDANVVPKADLDSISDADDGKKFKAQVRAFAPVLDAMRRSIYARVYLAACGGGRRLELFAARLKALTNLSVYWNDDTISFPKPPDAPFAEVGPIVGDKTSPLRDGVKFFLPDVAANKVPLRSKTDGFLEGSMSRKP